MHIGFFTNTYRPTMSGVVRSIDTFREAFISMGHSVFIFAQKAHDYEDSEPFIFRYPALEVPWANDYAFPVPYSSSIDKILPSLKLDVIHSHHPFLLGETAAAKAKALKIPMVFTFHTRYDEYTHYVPFSPDLTKFALDQWMARYLEKCQHIVTPSESIKQILIDQGIEGDITAVPTGINIVPFQEADGQPVREKLGWGDDIVLISVGRLAKEKNFETLLRAAAQVMRERRHVRLVIVGGGLEEKSLTKLAQKLGVAEQVQITGTIPFEEIPSYLKAADIFCFASVSETQGLVTMEAMAADLPIVAVDATGTSDAVQDGKDGLLTDNDPEALAAALEKVIDNAGLRQHLQKGAQEKVQYFDRNRQAQRMLEVYAQAKEAKLANRYIDTNILRDITIEGRSMTNIPIQAQVECSDGSAGRSTAVIFNPVTRTVTHFAVQEHESLSPTARLVPVDLVSTTSPDKIFLSCSKAELAELELFSETHYIQNEETSVEYLEPYMTSLDANYLTVETESVPPGELAVRRGTTVEAADGYIGQVGEFVVDPMTMNITHMVLSKGHAWDKKEVTVPVGAIDTVDGSTVYLRLTKAELASLPSIALKRDRHDQQDIDLMVWSFAGAGTSDQGLQALRKLAKDKEIKLLNTALVTKDQDGKTSLNEAEDLATGRGALFGAIAGGVIGLLGGPVGVVIGAAAGAATGGAAAHYIDMGFANDDLKALQESLQPDSSALVILVDSSDASQVSAALDDLGGERVQQTLTDEMVEQILSRRDTEQAEEEE